MASIVKRKKKYSVVYRYLDENGKEHQKWETFETHAEAKKRKIQVESQLEDSTFIPPKTTTVKELLAEYLATYGSNTWALSTYSGKESLIANYINPYIGDKKIQDITPKMIDRFYQDLLKVPSASSKYHHAKAEYVTPKTVHEVHKILRSAFSVAEKWEIIQRNPCRNAILPKYEKVEREIWDADTLFKAIEACEDDDLKLGLNLAFSCSLRMGEMLGLTWDCVEISDEAVERGEAYIYINKELQRVQRDALEKLDSKDVILRFPITIGGGSTVLVLKTPKTKTSVRKVYLPKTVAEMLLMRRMDQAEIKDIMGSDYNDYGLVFANINGRPIEASAINRAFSALIRDNNLPRVVFHSLRHTSITYKLKLTGGDVKAVQGDSGHAQSTMVTDVYSHILDESRQANASLIEEAFYKNGAEAKSVRPDRLRPSDVGQVLGNTDSKEEAKEISTEKDPDDMATLMRLLQNPEIAGVLKNIVKAM